jgi:hypothetical protein
MTGQFKQEKLNLSSNIDDLEAIAEVTRLTTQKIDLKSQYNAKLAVLLRRRSSSGTKDLRPNSSWKKIRKRDPFTVSPMVHSMVQEEDAIEAHEQLKSYITSYYKSLFDASEELDVTLDESRTGDIPQVSPKENMFLNAPYSEEEVRKAVFQMEHNKAPGPDGFSTEFFQTFWDIIKGDLLMLFSELHAGQ